MITSLFNTNDLDKLLTLTNKYIIREILEEEDEEKVLFTAFKVFSEENWPEKATKLLTDLIQKAENNKADNPHYRDALKELQNHLLRKQKDEEQPENEKGQFLLALFYAAHQLSFYEFSPTANKEEGEMFKGSLADNVDPKTRGQGSFLGYLARFKNYLGEQMILHKDDFKQETEKSAVLKFSDNNLKSESANSAKKSKPNDDSLAKDEPKDNELNRESENTTKRKLRM